MSTKKVRNSKQNIIKLNLFKRSNNITFTTTIITISSAKQLLGAFYKKKNQCGAQIISIKYV